MKTDSLSDTALREVFHAGRPSGGKMSQADFMASLQQRLDAVEEVKRYHDAQIRRYRIIARTAFGTGLAVGILLVVLILMRPFALSADLWPAPVLLAKLSEAKKGLASVGPAWTIPAMFLGAMGVVSLSLLAFRHRERSLL